MNREKPEWVNMNLAYWAGVAGLLLGLKALDAGLLVVQAFEDGDKWALLYRVALCGLFGWASGYALRESADAMGLTRKGRRE